MRTSGGTSCKKAQQVPWFWDRNRLCQGAIMGSQFSGGWAGVRIKYSPLRDVGTQEAHNSPWRARRDREKGGTAVLHLCPLPWHTVPWLLDRRNNVCTDRYEKGLTSFTTLHKSQRGWNMYCGCARKCWKGE